MGPKFSDARAVSQLLWSHKVGRSGFPWEKTTKGDVASVYTHCETAVPGHSLPGCALEKAYAWLVCILSLFYNYWRKSHLVVPISPKERRSMLPAVRHYELPGSSWKSSVRRTASAVPYRAVADEGLQAEEKPRDWRKAYLRGF